MPTINWPSGLDIGHPKIDQQHRQIVALLNDIIGSFESGNHDRVEDSCVALHKLLAEHFEFETEVLTEAGFPNAEQHQHAHDKSLAAVERLVGKCGQTCRHAMPSECAAEWCYIVVDHLVRGDLEFKSFLQEHDKP